MKKKIIPIILVSLSIVLFMIAIILLLKPNYFSFSNQLTNQETNENQIREEEKQTTIIPEIQEEQSTISKEETKQEQSTISKEETKQEQSDINETVTSNQENKDSVIDNSTNESKKDENDVISYFSKEDLSISSSTNQDDRTLREKAKNAFVTLVDFIFYDREVKGYTFKELTTSAKLKVIEIALSIDNKIDKYFPDYKDVIKDKYDNIKGKLAVKYLEFTSTLCEKVGKDTCDQAKENFSNMKENFSITWQLIKELASSASTKVKDFYESWRDS